eukprot:3626811-Pyramimonas_sp.AAC.1
MDMGPCMPIIGLWTWAQELSRLDVERACRHHPRTHKGVKYRRRRRRPWARNARCYKLNESKQLTISRLERCDAPRLAPGPRAPISRAVCARVVAKIVLVQNVLLPWPRRRSARSRVGPGAHICE